MKPDLFELRLLLHIFFESDHDRAAHPFPTRVAKNGYTPDLAVLFDIPRESDLSLYLSNFAYQESYGGYDDDGESCGGKRLYHLLKSSCVEGVVVVVTRWFGLIEIGNDRFKHINEQARQLLVSQGYICAGEGLESPNSTTKSSQQKSRDEVSAEERQAAVTVWDLDDGVGNLEFNRGAMLGDRKGRLLFGGDRGVTRFRPEAIEPSAYRPPIRLEGVTVVSRRGTRRLDLVPADLLEIGPEVTSFTVE
ncbi:MAG: YigZ family protein, partial [Planctomycetota bacterium]